METDPETPGIHGRVRWANVGRALALVAVAAGVAFAVGATARLLPSPTPHFGHTGPCGQTRFSTNS